MKNLIFIGMIGSGLKSVAEEAAVKLERKFVDTDEVLTRNTGLSLHDLYSLLPLDAFNDLTYRLAAQLAQGEDYVIAVGDSILNNPEAMKELKNTAFTVYIEQNVYDIVNNCSDPSHPLLVRGLHRVEEIFSERENLLIEYADIVITCSESAAIETIKAYNQSALLTPKKFTDPALHAFFRYYIENKFADIDSVSFANECSEAVYNILEKYTSEVNDNEH